jgi:hypothetical protein
VKTRASRKASGGEDLAGVRVVDAEALALELGARDADRVLAGDVVELGLAEGQGHHELAEVVQEAGEVRGLGVGAGALGEGAGDRGHLARVDVQEPPRGAAGAGRELEEAADRGLDGEAPDADAPDEVHRLAQGLRPDRPRAGSGVGESQDVGGQARIGLERGDELVGVGLGVGGELADAVQRTIEHRELADARDRVLQACVDRRGVSVRGLHRPGTIVGSPARELSGRAPAATARRAWGAARRAGSRAPLGRHGPLAGLSAAAGCRRARRRCPACGRSRASSR